MNLEERVAIEGILEQIDKRLNHIESNMINLNILLLRLKDEIILYRCNLNSF